MLPCGNGFRGSINTIRIYRSKRRVSAFLIDEIILQIGSNNEAWIWIAIEPIHKQILEVHISRHRNMIIAERGIISQFINKNLW
jgi:transposase-like protein